MSMMKKYLSVNWKDFLLMALLPAGGLVLLELFHALGNGLSGDHAIIYVGGLLFPLLAGGMALFSSMGQVTVTYDQSVKLGRTRRETVACVLVLCLVESAFAFAAAGVCTWVEGLLGAYLWPALYPDALPELLFLNFFPLWSQALAAAICPLAGFGFGAMIHRFGRRAFWVLWCLWMAVFLGMSNIDHDWVDRILRTADISLLPLVLAAGGVALVALLLWSLWYLLRAPVQA